MNKNNLSVLVVIAGMVISSGIMGSALAQTLQPQEQKMPGDIQYPIPELGNCKNKEACKVFCDDSKNIDVCLKFAEERNLLSSEELAMAKKFKEAGMIGPGGCNGQTECDKYCGVQEHMEECVNFAIKNGMMDSQKQVESEKILSAIKRGVKMPACNGQEECDKYCSVSEHMEECINFAIEAGIMDKGEQDEAKKVLSAIKRGVKMPACNGQEECDKYCSVSEHMEECINFAIEADMMSQQEKEKAQKMLVAIKQGITPPACKGEQECQKYCAQESHLEECIKFGEATGMMNAEDVVMLRKTGGKGPGGCVSKEACQIFCDDPNNSEICFQFGKENGLIPAEDLKKMEEGQQKMKDSFGQMPEEVLSCLNSLVGADMVEKIKSGAVMPNQKFGESIGKCFQQSNSQGKMPDKQGQVNSGDVNNMPGDMKDCLRAQIGEDGLNKIQSGNVDDPNLIEKAKPCFDKYGQQGRSGENFQPGSGTVNPGDQQMPQQAGPGGCKGPEECKTYCESHQEECRNFQQGSGNVNLEIQQVPQQTGMGMGGFQAGPGGCKSQEECQKYCSLNPDECKNFGGGQLAPGTQTNQVPPEMEKEIRAQIEEAMKNGQMPPQGFIPPQGQSPFGGQPMPPVGIQPMQ